MTPDEALTSIRGALSEDLGVPVEQIVPAASLRDDLELDSLDMAELLANLEDRTQQSIGTEMIEGVETISDVVRLVCTLAERANA